MERFRSYLAQNDVTGYEANQGILIGKCLQGSYLYDPSRQSLALEPESLPKNLMLLDEEIRSAALLSLLNNILGIGPGSNIPGNKGLQGKRHPGHYGVYDYVIPTIKNNSSGGFGFASQDMSNGTLYSYTQFVKSGDTVELFEADSTKLSGLGVGGTIVYLWGDNQTALNIKFFLNTIFTSTFTVGTTGPLANRLSVTITDNSPDLDGYTYLNPVITVADT